MFGLENRGETSYRQKMTISILYFLRFDTLENLTGDYFVLRIYEIMCSKQKKDALFISVFFQTLFPQHILPIHLYRVAYKWRMNRITYQPVHDQWNIN